MAESTVSGDESEEALRDDGEFCEETDSFEDPIAILEFLPATEHGGPNRKIPIYPGVVTRVGRDNKCEWTIEDTRVSKEHFKIYTIIYEKKNPGEESKYQPFVYCEDLQSTNGTYVNHVLIGQICLEKIGYLLTDGDIIEIKPSWRFLFHQSVLDTPERNQHEVIDMHYYRDRYAVSDRVLGSGQYGKVYLAHEVSTWRQLACKIVELNEAARQLAGLHNTSTRDDSLTHDPLRWIEERRERQKAMREIEILSKLSHPHIVNLRKAFVSENMLYMFTDLASGGDLFSYLDDNGGQLSDWESRVIARQVVLALDFMHSRGIAHRDIKPENVLITQTDFGGRVVLTDFGFANYISKGTGRLMSKLGTPGYIAPEIGRVELASGGYTTAADIWSLGVLTAHLLTGYDVIPREESSQPSQEDIAELFFARINCTRHHRIQQMGPRALGFLRKLLVLDPEHRISASKALDHSWFKKPVSEATELENGYQRVIRLWKARNSEENVIESLPGRPIYVPPPTADHSDKPRSLLRRKLPDATASPYFNLDRHLLPKVPSKRRELLANLNESGSCFIRSGESQKTNSIANMAVRSKQDIVNVINVDGKDIFGTSQVNRPTNEEDADVDGVDIIPTKPVTEKPFGFNLSEPINPISSPPTVGRNSAEVEPDLPNNKRARRELVEQRLHDLAAKELPKYCLAKAYKDVVTKKRSEAKRSDFRIYSERKA